MSEKSRRGFAAMDPAKQREIASKGGKAAHAKGRAHEFTPEQAREAGRKGGLRAHQRGTAHEFTREEAREAGRKGGLSSHTGHASEGGSAGAGSATMEPPTMPAAENLPAASNAANPMSGGQSQPLQPPNAAEQPGQNPMQGQTCEPDTCCGGH